MKKIVFSPVFLIALLFPVFTFALTQPQIDSVIALLRAFNVDEIAVLKVEANLNASVPTVVAPLIVQTDTNQTNIVVNTQDVTPPVQPPIQPPPQDVIGKSTPQPSCTIDASVGVAETGVPLTILSWTSSNVDSGILYVNNGSTIGADYVWKELWSIKNVASGTEPSLHLDNGGDTYKVSFTGQYGNVECEQFIKP